jgi:hypothetical protein
MGIERVLNELASLELDLGYQSHTLKYEWPLIVIQDPSEGFKASTMTTRARLQEKFPGISIEILTVKSTKLGSTIGRLTKVRMASSRITQEYSSSDKKRLSQDKSSSKISKEGLRRSYSWIVNS